MLSYSEQRAQEILDLYTKVRAQVILNEIWEQTGVPHQFNSEGQVVSTRPISFVSLK